MIMVGISHEAELPKKPSIWAAIRHNGFAELMNQPVQLKMRSRSHSDENKVSSPTDKDHEQEKEKQDY